MVLSRGLLRRALLLLHALVREALRLGWEVAPYPGVASGRRAGIAITIGDHQYPVEIHELVETLSLSHDDVAASREAGMSRQRMRRANRVSSQQVGPVRPTGRLRLVLPNGYECGRKNWSDGDRGPLEHKIESILRALELRAQADDEAAIQRNRRMEELRRLEEARERTAREAWIEHERLRRLLAEAEAWRRSAEVRAYVDELERRLPNLDEENRIRAAEWCRWARGWADRTDPCGKIETGLFATNPPPGNGAA